MKECRLCGQSKHETAFVKSKRTHDGLHNWCKVCRNARRRKQYANNNEIKRSDKKRQITREYQVEYDCYERLCAKADYRCMVCHQEKQSRLEASSKSDALHVDFDTTGGRRVGVLCDRCNTIVLHAGDDPELLEAIAQYLKTNRRKNKQHYILALDDNR